MAPSAGNWTLDDESPDEPRRRPPTGTQRSGSFRYELRPISDAARQTPQPPPRRLAYGQQGSGRRTSTQRARPPGEGGYGGYAEQPAAPPSQQSRYRDPGHGSYGQLPTAHRPTCGDQSYGNQGYGPSGAEHAPVPYGQQGYGQAPVPYGQGAVQSYDNPAARLRLASPAARLGSVLLDAVLIVVTLWIGWIIWSLVVWGRGTTPAKSLLHQRVVAADTGQTATWGHMAVRQFLVSGLLGEILAVLTLGIYFLVDAFMVFSDGHRRLTDRIASTLVVQD